MQFPSLYNLNEKQETQTSFGGLDFREACATPFFSDMENLTSTKYPLMSVRKKRGVFTSYTPLGEERKNEESVFITGKGGISACACVNNGFVCCSGSSVFADGKKIEGITLSEIDTPRTIVPFGKNFYIAPDGIFVKENNSEYTVSYAKRQNRSLSEMVVVMLCTPDGSSISPSVYSEEMPKDTSSGYTWVEKGENGLTLYLYNTNTQKWEKDSDVYVRISGAGLYEGISKGDRIMFSGFSDEELNKETTVLKVTNSYLLVNLKPTSHFLLEEHTTIYAQRIIPELDFAVELNNRIWGCRYGLNQQGEFVNEIYASALGDPLRWFDFDGISTDSYCASLGEPGEFTGAATLSGDVLFFKENCIIRISGSDPSSFTLNVLPARGVEKGSHLSVVNLNEKLFYKSHTGITVYDGAFPYVISEVLSDTQYKNAVGGCSDGKYYVAMENPSGEQALFVYDTSLGLWHKESSSYIQFTVKNGNCLYFICRATENLNNPKENEENPYSVYIHNCETASSACPFFCSEKDSSLSYAFLPENDIEWFAQTGMLGEFQGTSIVRSVVIRLCLEENSFFKAEILCNTNNDWQELCKIESNKTASFTVPVSTPRCDFYRLRFSGKGGCILYALSKNYELTSEVNFNGR